MRRGPHLAIGRGMVALAISKQWTPALAVLGCGQAAAQSRSYQVLIVHRRVVPFHSLFASAIDELEGIDCSRQFFKCVVRTNMPIVFYFFQNGIDFIRIRSTKPRYIFDIKITRLKTLEPVLTLADAVLGMPLISGMMVVKKKVLLKLENVMKMKLVQENWLSKNTCYKLSTQKIFFGCKINSVAIEDDDHEKEEDVAHASEDTPAHLQKNKMKKA
ncbi:hypothetical protein EVAR_22362_1 [Eumeta japonica]|uniref:Uncharacterized protein n=1 Tax=Eumeta variegata TaxID=151549 RepID=A0A4C1VJF7_EUMVA|nr:hypothetical protein EVAR_22362_1 [Eumeta japonica]